MVLYGLNRRVPLYGLETADQGGNVPFERKRRNCGRIKATYGNPRARGGGIRSGGRAKNRCSYFRQTENLLTCQQRLMKKCGNIWASDLVKFYRLPPLNFRKPGGRRCALPYSLFDNSAVLPKPSVFRYLRPYSPDCYALHSQGEERPL